MSAIATGTIAFAVLAFALAVLTQVRGEFALAELFAMCFGFGNGVLTIACGTVPAELFGRHAYGALLGRLARPQLVARALAPLALAAVITIDPDRSLALATLAVGGVLALVAYRRAGQRWARRPRGQARRACRRAMRRGRGANAAQLAASTRRPSLNVEAPRGHAIAGRRRKSKSAGKPGSVTARTRRSAL